MALTQLVMVHVTLPSTQRNNNPNPTTLDDDIATIRTALLAALNDGDVALLAHSFGGMSSMSSLQDLTPASRKAAGHTTAVRHAILIASFFAPVGGMAPEVLGDRAPPIGVPVGPFNHVGPGKAEDYFYADLTAAEAQKWTNLLKPISATAFLGKTTSEAWTELPISYLVCLRDQALLPLAQRWVIDMARDKGAKVRVEEFDSSHSPFLSMPERTGEFVRRSVGESI
ncbi:hypothetical protein B0A48_15190 [Cryoendolithus antarcticus]|uniref:AB hydrolase-1 domain-containing protein n=1 Tax=Cryoendolithus antarcticus TaxID=1507870 RepID=A0A1V8SI57_9PEZI|nr:hypothetical protein B0A48_15190 [Cryoendolithus antarcticus]